MGSNREKRDRDRKQHPLKALLAQEIGSGGRLSTESNDSCRPFQCSTGLSFGCNFAPSEHPPPHFHVYYAEHKAKVDIRTCEIIESNLPRRQTKLVLAWAELHQEELMADWQLVMNGEEPFKIQPLR